MPGAMIAVPSPRRSESAPAGLARNRSSSCALRHRQQLCLRRRPWSLSLRFPAVKKRRSVAHRRVCGARRAGSRRRPSRPSCRRRAAMKKPGMRGNTDASTTRSPRTAVHREGAVEHAASSRPGADRRTSTMRDGPRPCCVRSRPDPRRRSRSRARRAAPRRSDRSRSAVRSGRARSGSPATTACRSSPARVAAFLEVAEVHQRRCRADRPSAA